MSRNRPEQLPLQFIEDTPEYRRKERDRWHLEWVQKQYPATEEELACLPEGCRLCRFVPLSECDQCNFGPYDHTVGWKYPTKVCLKDLARLGLWRVVEYGKCEAVTPS